jgi:phosphoribosylamine--glycine ligase
MNIALWGQNTLIDAFIQYFSALPEIDIIYTYMLSEKSETNSKVINEKSKNWIEHIKDLESKSIDLAIVTHLVPQLHKDINNFAQCANFPVLMPSYDVSWLEWSKINSKQLFKQLGIPTPNFEIISYEKTLAEFKNFNRPYVLKYDKDFRRGLQTIVIDDDNVDLQFELFKKSGRQKYSKLNKKTNDFFIKEKYTKGIEYSYHVLSNGSDCIYLGSARDYKKRYENDIGDNTTSMGSYSPVDYIDHSVLNYAKKLIKHFKDIGTPYVGIIYLGILVDEFNNHLLLEVNTRFGCPEFISILSTIENDLLETFIDGVSNTELYPIIFNNNKVVTVRLVNKNAGNKYPSFINVPKNIVILNELNENEDIHGPMLMCVGSSLSECTDAIYNYLENSDLGDYSYRSDIGVYL